MHPRAEHPRPQFVRADWLSLNGRWEFEIDGGDSGLARGLLERPLEAEIVVPFCPESNLSGVGNTDFMESVWYRRTVEVPDEWRGRRLLLHFQAVDHDATVWVDGNEVARHRGGWTPFSADLGIVSEGAQHTVVVRARDSRSAIQARGKQSDRYENYACLYTRTTGIWQPVWLEAVGTTYLLRPRITPSVSAGSFTIEVALRGPRDGMAVRVRLLDDGGAVAEAEVGAEKDFGATLVLTVPPDRRRLWGPDDPFLYDLELELLDAEGNIVDRARSYAGLRSVAISGDAILLNGRSVFQRLVLDQGYYPDGVMTAPSDAALVEDIELAQAAGFNGARLHQKVFEERFLYHCDRLGYLVWGEFGDWGARSASGVEPTVSFVAQWLEALERDYSHPSIVGWCPLNETYEQLGDRITTLDDATRAMFLATKAADRTRPVIDSSGFSHRVLETDVYDSHLYEQDPVALGAAMARADGAAPFVNGLPGDPALEIPTILPGPWSLDYLGQPYFCSEFGGIWWDPDAARDDESWGYGTRPQSIEEFYARFEGLVSVLLDDPRMFGYCYTQLTDVFQETNGIYRFDRRAKFDVSRLHAMQTRRAAIEPADD
jgi:beta-galactosidase/beta-glucuronidase